MQNAILSAIVMCFAFLMSGKKRSYRTGESGEKVVWSVGI